MQEYKIVVRTFNNMDEASVAEAELNDNYLALGFKILSIDFLGEVDLGQGVVRGLRFGYHLVRDVQKEKVDK